GGCSQVGASRGLDLLVKLLLVAGGRSTGRALGDVLPSAVAIAIFPVPIIAVVLLVGSDRGRPKGVAFVGPWCIGLAAGGAGVLLLAGGADGSDEGAAAT